jgi:uncharacterized iron-regulated membrane protein
MIRWSPTGGALSGRGRWWRRRAGMLTRRPQERRAPDRRTLEVPDPDRRPAHYLHAAARTGALAAGLSTQRCNLNAVAGVGAVAHRIARRARACDLDHPAEGHQPDVAKPSRASSCARSPNGSAESEGASMRRTKIVEIELDDGGGHSRRSVGPHSGRCRGRLRSPQSQ